MVNIMKWVSDRFMDNFHHILNPPLENMNTIGILKNVLKDNMKANCLMHSVVLTEIYLSLGYQARTIRCMPLYYKNDCHCVTIVYSKIYNKWVIMDPSNRTYYLNRKAIPLGIEEFRELMIKNDMIMIPLAEQDFSDKLIKYWYGNLFCFESYADTEFNCYSNKKYKIKYILVPEKYRQDNKVINEMKSITEYRYISNPDFFWQKPKEFLHK